MCDALSRFTETFRERGEEFDELDGEDPCFMLISEFIGMKFDRGDCRECGQCNQLRRKDEEKIVEIECNCGRILKKEWPPVMSHCP